MSSEHAHFLVLFEESNGTARRKRASAASPGAPAEKRGRPPRASRLGRVSSRTAGAGTGQQPRVPAVDHPGPRGRQRRAAVGERGDPVRQRGAAEHQRGARHRQGGAAVDQRGAEHRQRGAARPQRGAEPRQQRSRQPAGQRPDRHRHRRGRPAHPALHADGGEGPQPHPARRRPPDRPYQAEHRLPRSRGADRRRSSTR